ncbi:hypothetical protein [Salinibacterium sp. ZJ77]|nr:hypothetical protein [Salinibacterium sp. ZJ77]
MLDPEEYGRAGDAWLRNHELIHELDAPDANVAAARNIRGDIYD